jgi:hypothetical protein
MPSLLRTSSGFTYIAALFIVVVMGIMAGMSGTTLRMIMKREREEELLWRGMQVSRAIARWKYPKAGATRMHGPRELKELLLDPNSLAKVRYLPRLFDDPMTGKEWVVITDPNLGVIGVRSNSNEEPLRQTNFEDKFDFSLDNKETKEALKAMLKGFEGKKKYSEWEFAIRPPGAVAPGTAPGTLPLGKFGEQKQDGSTAGNRMSQEAR